MGRSSIAAALALGAAALAATPAQAELVSAANPQKIKEIMESRGWPANLVMNAGEDPYIESDRDGLQFLVIFMNCTAGRNCRTLQYYMGFGAAKNVSLERFNEWNREKRFARAYRSKKGAPVLEMDVDVDFKGIPRENLSETFNTWAALMDSYRDFVFGDG